MGETVSGELERFVLEKRTVDEVRELLEANNVSPHRRSGKYELYVQREQIGRTEDVLDLQHLRRYFQSYASD
ncbi:MAG: hypothetical protein ABEJ72_11335 [Candidatus Aenigmatarchaeota archaeon]